MCDDLAPLSSAPKHPSNIRQRPLVTLLAAIFWCQSYGVLADSSDDLDRILATRAPPAKEAQLQSEPPENIKKAIKPRSRRPRVTLSGKASWYGPGFQGKPTASGEVFDQRLMTAAHKTLPLGSKAKVTNPANGNSVEVKINDRGPHIDGRIIDLSHAAAGALGILTAGVAQVKVEVLTVAEG